MQKISARHAVAILSEIPGTLRKLASRNEQLEAENYQLRAALGEYQLNERVEKLASRIHEKGVHKGMTLEETKAALMEKRAELDVVSEAVDRIGRQQTFGVLGDKAPGSTGNAEADFANALLSY